LDVGDLVYTHVEMRMLFRRLAGIRALHYAALGGLLFAIQTWRGVVPGAALGTIEISTSEVEAWRESFERDSGRRPRPSEEQSHFDSVVEERILFEYGMRLGVETVDSARARLQAVAQFMAVEGESDAPKALVNSGVALHDIVFRGHVVNLTRNLIREGAEQTEPSEEAIEAYLRAHPERFLTGNLVRVSQVLLARADEPEAAAADRLSQLRRDDPEEPPAEWPLEAPVGSTFGLLSQRDLERKFGAEFAQRVMALSEGSWQGPIRSRHGWHAVRVHERSPSEVLPLDSVREQVRFSIKKERGDEWMARRLAQLRKRFDVRIDWGSS